MTKLDSVDYECGRGHYYYHPKNGKMASVTSVLETIYAPRLEDWKIKQGIEYALKNDLKHVKGGLKGKVAHIRDMMEIESDNNKLIGTITHTEVENYLNTGVFLEEAHSEAINNSLESFMSFIDSLPEDGWKLKSAENQVWHSITFDKRKYWYAGTVDTILEIDGLDYLLDWKTSRTLTLNNKAQVVAYGKAYDAKHKKKLSGKWVVRIPKISGDYFDQYIVDDQDEQHCWNIFRGCLVAFHNLIDVEENFDFYSG